MYEKDEFINFFASLNFKSRLTHFSIAIKQLSHSWFYDFIVLFNDVEREKPLKISFYRHVDKVYVKILCLRKKKLQKWFNSRIENVCLYAKRKDKSL